VGITAGSREVPGRNAYDRRHTYCIIIIRRRRNRGTIGQKKHWYELVPKSVETIQGESVTILWIQQVQTDRTIPNNEPDITIRANEKATCM